MSDLGTFASIQEVWEKYPSGGKEGDTLIVKEIEYSWDKYNLLWKANGEESFSDGYPVKTIEGDLAITNDVRIGGTLYAKNIKGANRGLFPDIESLPTDAEEGDWCVVGDTIPGPIWNFKKGKWIATGEIGGVDAVDLVGYATTQALDEAKKVLTKSIDDSKEALTTSIKDTEDKLTTLVNDEIKGLNDTKGNPNGVAPLDENSKVPSEYLPEPLSLGESEAEAFPGDRGKSLEDTMTNIPSDIIKPDSFSVLSDASYLNVSFKKVSKTTGKETDDSFRLPSATLEQSGLMSAEDKQALEDMKSGTPDDDVTHPVVIVDEIRPLKDGYYTLELSRIHI